MPELKVAETFNLLLGNYLVKSAPIDRLRDSALFAISPLPERCLLAILAVG